jgi:hypothetical protein
VGFGAAGTGPRGAGGVGTAGAPSGKGIEREEVGGEAQGWPLCVVRTVVNPATCGDVNLDFCLFSAREIQIFAVVALQ